MKNTFKNPLGRMLAVGSALAALSLFAPAGFGQQGPQAVDLGLDRADELVLAEPGQMLEMGDGQIINGDVIISGAGCDIIVHPGVQTINGNLQVNGSNDHIIFEFSEKKENGQLKVDGTLQLGPDNSPLLNLDLRKTNLVRGEVFTIVSANEIIGEFNGMGHGEKMNLGDYSVQINYEPASISLVVLKAPKRPHPRITPIIELDNSLIDPTSTAPGSW